MKSTLTTLFIIGCLVLIVMGSWGYIDGRIDFKRQSFIAQSPTAEGFEAEAKKGEIKKSIFNSTIMLIGGALGIFIIIYNLNKPVKKKKPYYYNN